MITRTKLHSYVACLLLGLSFITGSVAVAVQPAWITNTLSFEDLGQSPGGVHMATNYGGFKWFNSNWHYMSAAAVPTNTYLALSGTSTAIFRAGGEDFYFDGADYWSRRGADANGSFYFILHRDGVMVYDGREDNDGRQRFTGVPQHFTANYTGMVDTVAVVFTQGGDDWDHLAMDNFQFRALQTSPQPPQLELSRQSDGFLLRFNVVPGLSCGIEASTDLSSEAWTRLATVTADGSGVAQFLDTNTNLVQRFYRAVYP